jgi:hypothetical protein
VGWGSGVALAEGDGLALGASLALAEALAEALADGALEPLEPLGLGDGLELAIVVGEGEGVKVGTGALGPGVRMDVQAYALPVAFWRTMKPITSMPASAKTPSSRPP